MNRISKSLLGTVLVALFSVVFVLPAKAQLEPDYRIVDQPEAPLSMEHYRAQYDPDDDGIQHTAKYVNNRQKTIEAVEIGLVSFDVFNDVMDVSRAIQIETLTHGDTSTPTWTVYTADGDEFTFLTGAIFVSRVRFEDGKIWRLDPENIVRELQVIDEDFTLTELGVKGDEDE